ncbi:MAG: hypothetical protein M3Z04_23645 [Chloroflexota bacterium]|nr:hypothetical protein [Chloroflexota bacterium]
MDSDELEIIFGGASGWFRFSLVERMFPNAKDPWDQDQIATYVLAGASQFQGRLLTNIGSHELVRLDQLLDELYQHVGQEQTVQFQLNESMIDINIRMDRQGRISMEVDVTAASYPTDAHFLVTIEADQSYLPGWRSQIQRTLKYFPSMIDKQP